MSLDATLELSVEQLIGALNKKIFMECTRVQSITPPVSRALVFTLTAEVDALEKRANEILREVVSLRNFLRPVNRLPPEVITLCAAFVSDTDPKSTVLLTHVCRYWRKTIASNPRNWASMSNRWKRLIPLCLERAGEVPLSVDIKVSDMKGDEISLQALLPHVSRISHLSLTEYSSIEGVADDLPGLFVSPMLNLTSMELEQIDESTEPLPPNGAPAPPLFQNVSKLKSLHLTRTPLYPAVFSITSLVELKLVGYTIPFHFGEFIELLHSNQNLELAILELQFTEGSVEISPERKVSLPQLRRLEFTCGSAADARGLLSYVSLRRDIHIAIQGSHSNPCGDLASFLPSPPTPIRQLFAPITAIEYWGSPVRHRTVRGDGQLSVRTSKAAPVMYDVFMLFVTEAVREFHIGAIRIDPGDRRLSWPLGRLPALETLVLSEMSISPGSLSVLAEEPMLCPSLKTIAFFDCKMSEDAVRELGEVLEKRRDSTTARLYRVVIINNTQALPDLQLIHKLRKLVPHVDIGVDDKLPDFS